jgi:hypothetical protein
MPNPFLSVMVRPNHARPRMSGLRGLRGLRGLGQATAASTATPALISPGTHPSGPFGQGQNQANLMAQQAVIDQNPTDYSSPQSAIAAGLDPTMVYAAWAKGLAQYSTQDAAVAAGIMPGVVTQLWGLSRQYAAVGASAPNYAPMVAVGCVVAILIFLHVGDKGGANP